MENFNAKKPNKKKPKKKEQPNPENEHKSNVEAHVSHFPRALLYLHTFHQYFRHCLLLSDLPYCSNVQMHQAMGSDWLATGQCPIAKSFRAVSGVLPLVSKMLKLPQGMKYRCPPAIVAARAALARTSAVKALRPQGLPTKVLAIGMLGMALNVPLGVWREHTKKFSPQWFLAVHATIPFIAMLRKAVVMPKYAIAFTIGSAVLGQAVGARAERLRLANLRSSQPQASSRDSKLPPTDAASSPKSVVEDVEKESEERSRGGPRGLQCGSETTLVDRSALSSFALPVSVS